MPCCPSRSSPSQIGLALQVGTEQYKYIDDSVTLFLREIRFFVMSIKTRKMRIDKPETDQREGDGQIDKKTEEGS